MSRLSLPREHGVWAMLAYPFITALLLRLRGAWAGGDGSAADWLRLILAAALAYASFDALRRAMRRCRAAAGPLPAGFLMNRHTRWGLAYATGSLAVAWTLFGRPELRPLCFVAGIGALALLINLAVVRFRGEKGLAGEVLGALTLSLAMPAALVLAFEGWRRGFGGIWTLAFLFNAGSVFYVKMIREAMNEEGPGEDFPRHLRHLGSFVLVSFGVVAGLLLRGAVSWPGALSLLPFWLMVQWGIRNPRQHGDFRGLGWALLAQAILFSLILGVAA